MIITIRGAESAKHQQLGDELARDPEASRPGQREAVAGCVTRIRQGNGMGRGRG